MPMFVFQVRPPRGVKPLHHSELDDLQQAADELGLSMVAIGFHGSLSEHEGVTAGGLPLAVTRIRVDHRGTVTADAAAALLRAALTRIGRPRFTVAVDSVED